MFVRLLVVAGGTSLAGGCYLAAKGNERFYRSVVMPAFQTIDAERAHVLGVKCASYGIVPRIKTREEDRELLKTQLFGLSFDNPVGLAAGYDKHGECVDGMLKTGFGFVEVGSVTPKPQVGNAKPRVFRLKEDSAVINRYGFNSDGLDAVKQRLQARDSSGKKETGVVGINLGKNKMTEEAVKDYVLGLRTLQQFADYVVINISSPNTPGLRKMQGREQLSGLLKEIVAVRNEAPPAKRPPLLVKVAPDLTAEDITDIVDVVTTPETAINGLIVSNTTVTRPDSLLSDHKTETGGLSGKPVKDLSTKTIREFYVKTEGKVPIVGVGGVSTGSDAYEKIKAGASLVQLYTVMAYEGPPVVGKIKRELAELLRKDGFENVAQAVGKDHKTQS